MSFAESYIGNIIWEYISGIALDMYEIRPTSEEYSFAVKAEEIRGLFKERNLDLIDSMFLHGLRMFVKAKT